MIDRVRKNPLFRAAALGAALLTLLLAAGCGGGPSKDEPDAYTKHFVQEALDRYEHDGLQATLDYYNSPESIDGQWYVFIVDENDLFLAHAAAPQLLGESWSARWASTAPATRSGRTWPRRPGAGAG